MKPVLKSPATIHSNDAHVEDKKEREIEKKPKDIDQIKSSGSSSKGKLLGNFTNDSEIMDFEPYDKNILHLSFNEEASKQLFTVSDLVWGKVRSHPWWPGQILDPSDASYSAKRHFKKDSYLIAYFGDYTFAWNEVSKLKHFRPHYMQMENQSSLLDFHDALNSALSEVSRRIEFGLACSCIPREELEKIRTQKMENAGVREESSRREGGDRFSTVVSFKPLKLVEYVKALACISNNGAPDRLSFVTVHAQLSAFQRWKGYPQLPEFQMFVGSLESKLENPLLIQKPDSGFMDAAKRYDFDENTKSEDLDGSAENQSPSSPDDIFPMEREKTLSELIADKRQRNSKFKYGSKGKSIAQPLLKRNKKENTPAKVNIMKNGNSLLSSSKKQKTNSVIEKITRERRKRSHSDKHQIKDLMLEDSDKECRKDSVSSDEKHKKANSITESKLMNKDHTSSSTDVKLPSAKPTFRVGLSILRVASQMKSSPILKPCKGHSQRASAKKRKKEKSESEDDELTESSSEDLSAASDQSFDGMIFERYSQRPSRQKKRERKLDPETGNITLRDNLSVEKMIGRLYTAAKNPLQEHDSIAGTGFLINFRNSVSDGIPISGMSEKSIRQDCDGVLERRQEEVDGSELQVSGNKNDDHSAPEERPEVVDDSELPLSGNAKGDNAAPQEQGSFGKQGGTIASEHGNPDEQTTFKIVTKPSVHQLKDSVSRQKDQVVQLDSKKEERITDLDLQRKLKDEDLHRDVESKKLNEKSLEDQTSVGEWSEVLGIKHENPSEINTSKSETESILDQVSDSDCQQKHKANSSNNAGRKIRVAEQGSSGSCC